MGQIANPGRNAIERYVAARRERQEMAELRSPYALLTPRERHVLAGIIMGRLNKQIAADLGTSEVTVKEQRGHHGAEDACRIGGRVCPRGRAVGG